MDKRLIVPSLTREFTYLEFRNFDLNPFERIGISQTTMDTVHLLILAFLWLDSPENVDQALAQGHALNEKIALSHPLKPLPSEAKTQDIVTALDQLVQHFGLGDYHQDLVKQVKAAFADPNQTLSAQLLPYIKDKSLAEFALNKALAYHDYDWTAHYALKGYEEMELSTQMLLFDAIQKGIHFEILDEQDQFLKLWHQDHVEYVKNGNMTSKDNYVVPLAMANKTVTKKILADAGFPVPSGDEFTSLEEGLAYYPLIKDKQIVVKPKSTNFVWEFPFSKNLPVLTTIKKPLKLLSQKILLSLLKNLFQEPNTVSSSWMGVVRLCFCVSLPMLLVMANTPFVN